MEKKKVISIRLIVMSVILLSILAALSAAMLLGVDAATVKYGTYDKTQPSHTVSIVNFTPEFVTVDASDLSGNDTSKFNPEYANPNMWEKRSKSALVYGEMSKREGDIVYARGTKNLTNFTNIRFKDLKDGYVPITIAVSPNDYKLITERCVFYGRDTYQWQPVNLAESVITFMNDYPTDGLPESKHRWVTPDYSQDSNGVMYSFCGLKNDDSSARKDEFYIIAFAVPLETNSIKITTTSTESLTIGAKYTYTDDWKATVSIKNVASYPVLALTDFGSPSYPSLKGYAGDWSIEPTLSFHSPRFILPGRSITETKAYSAQHRTQTGWTLNGRVLPEDVFATASAKVTNLTYAASKYSLVAAESTVTKKFSCFFPGDANSIGYDVGEVNRAEKLSVSGSVAIKHYAELEMDKSVNIPTRNITVRGDAKLSTAARIAMVVRAHPSSSLGIKLNKAAPTGSSFSYLLKHRVYWWKANERETRKYENGYVGTSYDKVPYYNKFKTERETNSDTFKITIPIDVNIMKYINNEIYTDAEGEQTIYNTSYFDFYIFYDYQKQWEVSYDYLVNNTQYNIKPDFSTALRGKSEGASGSSATYNSSTTGNGLYDMSGNTFALVRDMNMSGVPASPKLHGTTTPTDAEMRYKALSFEILEDDSGSNRRGVTSTTESGAYTLPDGTKTSRKGTWYRLEGEVIRINKQLTLFRNRIGEGAQETLFDNSYGIFVFIASETDYLTMFSRGYSTYLLDNNYKATRGVNDRQYYQNGGGTKLLDDFKCDLSSHSSTWYASQYYAGNFSYIFGSEKAAEKRLTKVKLLPYTANSGLFIEDPVLSKIIKGEVSHLYPYQNDVGVGIRVVVSGADTITNFLPFIPDELMDFGLRKWFDEHIGLDFNLDEIRLPYTGGVPAMKFASPIEFAAVVPMFVFEAGVTFSFDCNTLPEQLDDAYISVRGSANLFDQLEVEGELLLKWYNDGTELIPDRIMLGFGSDLLGIPPEVSIVAIEKLRGSIDGLGKTFGDAGSWNVAPPISVSLSGDFSVKLDAKATEIGLHANDVGITVGFEGFEIFMESVTLEALGATISLLDESSWGITWDFNSQVDIFGDGTYIPFPTVKYYGSGGIDLGIEGTSLAHFIKGRSSLYAELDTSVIVSSLMRMSAVRNSDKSVEIRQRLVAWKDGARNADKFFDILKDLAEYAAQELSSFTNALTIEGEASGEIRIPDGVPFVGGKTIVKGDVTYGIKNSVLSVTAVGEIPVLGTEASVTMSYNLAVPGSGIDWDVSLFSAKTINAQPEQKLTSAINNGYKKTVSQPSGGAKLLSARTRAASSDWTFNVDNDDQLLVEIYANSPMAITLTNSGGLIKNITADLATDLANGWVADYGEYEDWNKPAQPLGYRYTFLLKKSVDMGEVNSVWTVPAADGIASVSVMGLIPVEKLSAISINANGDVSFTLQNQISGVAYAATVSLVPANAFDANGLPLQAGTVIALHIPVSADGATTVTLSNEVKRLLSGTYRAFVKIEKYQGEDADDRYVGIGINKSTDAAQTFSYTNPAAPAAPTISNSVTAKGTQTITISKDSAVSGYKVTVFDVASGKAVETLVTTTQTDDHTIFTIALSSTVIAGKEYYAEVTPYVDIKDGEAFLARISGSSASTAGFVMQPLEVTPALSTETGVLTYGGTENQAEIYYAQEAYSIVGDSLEVDKKTVTIAQSVNTPVSQWSVEVALHSKEYSYKTDANGDKYSEVKTDKTVVDISSGGGTTLASLLAYSFEIDCGAQEVWDDLNGLFVGTSDRVYVLTLKYVPQSGNEVVSTIEIRFDTTAPEVELDTEYLSYDGSTLVLSGKADDSAILSLRYSYIDEAGELKYSQPIATGIIRGNGSFAYSSAFTAEQITETHERLDDNSNVITTYSYYYNIELVATNAVGGEVVYSLVFDAAANPRLWVQTSLLGGGLAVGMSGITLSTYLGNGIEPLSAEDVSYSITSGGDKLRIQQDGTLTALAAGEATIEATYNGETATLILEVVAEQELVPVSVDQTTDTAVSVNVGDVMGGGDITAEISTDGTNFTACGKVSDSSYTFDGLSPFTNYTLRFTPQAGGYEQSVIKVRTAAAMLPIGAVYSVIYDMGDATDGQSPIDPTLYSAGDKVTLRDVNTLLSESRLEKDGMVVSGFSTLPGGHGDILLYGIDGYDEIVMGNESLTLYPIFADIVVYDQLRSMLGLEGDASVADVIKGLDELKKDNSAVYTQLRDALGLDESAALTDIIKAVGKLESDGNDVYNQLREELNLPSTATLADIIAAINALEKPTITPPVDTPESKGLPFGAGIGIGIGATAAVAVAAFAVYWFILRKRLRK